MRYPTLGGAAVDGVSGEKGDYQFQMRAWGRINRKSNLPLKISVPQWNLQPVGPPGHMQATPVLEELNSYVTLAQEITLPSGV